MNATTQHMSTESTTDDHDHDSEYTDAMIYGYGTASVAIISLLSLAGIVLFPTLKSKSYKFILQFLIGLGVGTMTADALLHIIPSVLGIHVHDDEHDHVEEEEDLTHVWKMSVVFGGIYFFFFFENGLHAWKRYRASVSPNPPPPSQETSFAGNSSSALTSLEKDDEDIPAKLELEEIVEENLGGSSQEMLHTNDVVCLGLTTVLLTVFVGDALHNFADGIAIGVSFADSWPTGVGTSLAVLCHEIPHEFGDFAIYLNNGASKWKAIGLNVIAALCAFLGLYGGIALGEDEAVRSWLLAAVAGMFLYIALVQVAGEMVHEVTDRPLLQFVLQNLGLLLGWTIMLLIGLYEDDIQASISG